MSSAYRPTRPPLPRPNLTAVRDVHQGALRPRPRPVAATALVNILLPLVHLRMGTPHTSAPDVALLEPPGFLMLNYGPGTPTVTLAVHLAYGTIVGAFLTWPR